jgi:hypothetical protein
MRQTESRDKHLSEIKQQAVSGGHKYDVHNVLVFTGMMWRK